MGKIVLKRGVLRLIFIAVLFGFALYSTTQSTIANPLSPCADLVITDLIITPNQPVQGQNANINITILNQGSCATLSFIVQWKSSLLAPNGPSTHVNGLNPGQSTTISFDYAFPNAGNFTTIAIVDTDNTVDETNESNNIEILSVTVLPNLPDLVVTNIAIDPTLPVAGLNSQIDITIENQGSLDAGAFVVQWRADIFAPTGPSSQVSGLAAGQSTTISFNYAFANPGNFTTVATVDSTNTVNESNEDNNLEIYHVTVVAAGIDLQISSFTIEPEEPVRGRIAQATITVQNFGNFPAGDFIVQWKPTLLSPDYSVQVNGLGPGESTSVTFDHTYLLAGNFFTSATVDSTNWVNETNEFNNTQTMPITVQPPRADLVISSLTIQPNEPVRGLPATVSIVVENQGNSPAGNFVVEWKPTLLSPGLAQQIDGLDVGQSHVLTFDYTYQNVGQFTSIAEVDSTNLVLELDESNNTATLQVVVLQDFVDLLITDMSISPDPPLQGSPATISVEILNLGNSPSGSFILEWNPDSLGIIVPSPGTLSTQIDNLDGGQSMQVDFEFTYNEPGTYRTVARVDAFNSVTEINENNNLDILNVTVGQAAPDLLITEMDIFPDPSGIGCDPQNPGGGGMPPIEPELVQGENTAVCITVENQGNAPAGPFIVEWNPDALGVITPSPGTISTQVDGLAEGESQLVEFSFIYHQFGNFRTVAKVDAFNNVAESNEANNLDIINVIVLPAPLDLIITSFTIDPVSPIRGSEATASITVRNNGNYPVGDFWVQWRLTGENGNGPFGMIDGLLPNESKTVELQGVFFVAGSYDSFAIADVFDQVVETNENNNTAIRPVEVQPRTTTVEVTFNSMFVIEAFEDGCTIFGCDGEWDVLLIIVDPDDHCTAHIDPGGPIILPIPEIDIDSDGLECDVFSDSSVEDGDTLNLDTTFTVTLVESFPVLLGALAIQDGNTVELPDFAGLVLQLWGQSDYGGVGTITVPSIEGECPDGHCFDLTYTITVIEEPPPLSEGATELPPPDSIILPHGLSEILPANMELPEGVEQRWYAHLPMIIR